ncbi:unnamed protein product [Clavelina lepadiformis]|uniref:Secreted protein n=1 Tax=Clavelina lepadiformis TaxID=159417 RepID=A0ABP0EV49_CLALP
MFDRSNENGATLLFITVFGILVYASLLSTRQCEARMSQKRDAGSRRFEAHPNRQQAGVLAKVRIKIYFGASLPNCLNQNERKSVHQITVYVTQRSFEQKNWKWAFFLFQRTILGLFLSQNFKTSRKMWRRDAQIKSICCSYCAVYSCQAIPKALKGVRRSCLFCQQKYCLVGIWTTSGGC